MKRYIALALIALNIVSCLAAPQNNAAVEKSEKDAAGVVADKKGSDASLLESYQNDQMVRLCIEFECTWMNAGAAKGVAQTTPIKGVFAESRDNEMTKALTPTVETVMESMKGLDDQKAKLEKLQAQMAAMTSLFSKGAQAAEDTKGQFAAMMTKGVSLPAAPPSKGVAAAALPPGKGAMFAAPSKGSSAAATMQLEAAMCPMTMFELGKTQKLYAETNAQLQNANAMNAMLMGEKNALANAKAIAEMGKRKAEEQAAFNAKYAAEQKQRADMLALQLATANAEKAALQQQKAELEAALAATQQSLAEEKEKSATLEEALNSCNQEKAQLQEDKEALTNELKETQDVLRQTQTALEQEQNAHARTQRELAATEEELKHTEEARQQLEEAKQQLEDELSETKSQLEAMTSERNQLQVTLDATSTMLGKCNEEKMQCNVELSQEKAITAQLNKQLEDAVALLAAEKKAREELTALLMSVKDTAEKLQEEVQKLQLENVQLKQQLMKLKAEQETALAMAAGCPPTYEKFGLSCYKYVREKTQWKMAQEQCMKDGGNLVSVESRQEQAFLVDYLKRHGAEDDTYALTGGHKRMNHWKWLGSSEQYIGQTGPEYWFNEMTKRKPNYDCQAMYLRDASQYGKWVGMPCYSAAPFTCEYLIAPPGTPTPSNAAEILAMSKIYQSAPAYLANQYSKGSLSFAPPSKGAYAYAVPPSKGASLSFASKGVY